MDGRALLIGMKPEWLSRFVGETLQFLLVPNYCGHRGKNIWLKK
jgi:hypothetical protein